MRPWLAAAALARERLPSRSALRGIATSTLRAARAIASSCACARNREHDTQLSRSSDSPAAAKAQLDFVMARVNSTSGALILTGDLGFTPLDNGYDSLQAAGLQVRTLS